MTTIGLSYSLVKISTKCAPALLSQGSTFESINSDDIKNLKIKVPNFVEQQKIAAVLSTADEEITALKQKLNALKQEKKALMQQLLTGKRRVQIN
ncbi:hypothetical protein A6763_19470 [Aeromonas caviae]|nr:hypothetical protein A6763_19470 [Aeromonas caviae]